MLSTYKRFWFGALVLATVLGSSVKADGGPGGLGKNGDVGMGQVRSALCTKYDDIAAVVRKKVHYILEGASFDTLVNPPALATGAVEANPILRAYLDRLAAEAPAVAWKIASDVDAAMADWFARVGAIKCRGTASHPGSLGGRIRMALGRHVKRLFPRFRERVFEYVARESTLVLTNLAPSTLAATIPGGVDALRWNAELAKQIELIVHAIAAETMTQLDEVYERVFNREFDR